VTEGLTARDPQKPAASLDGRAIHGALSRFHRLAGYNEWAEELQDQRFINHGWFEGKVNDPLLRAKELPGPLFRVDVNKCYAHASEETLGAAAHFELGRFCGKRAGSATRRRKAPGS
jgi:hypothetical protein